MKERISATIDPKNKKILDRIMDSGKYRNQSHIIEKAIELLEREEEKEKNASKK